MKTPEWKLNMIYFHVVQKNNKYNEDYQNLRTKIIKKLSAAIMKIITMEYLTAVKKLWGEKKNL